MTEYLFLLSRAIEADGSDLFDGTLRVKLHGENVPLGDAAILAAFLPADQRDVVLGDVAEQVRFWFDRRAIAEQRRCDFDYDDDLPEDGPIVYGGFGASGA